MKLWPLFYLVACTEHQVSGVCCIAMPDFFMSAALAPIFSIYPFEDCNLFVDESFMFVFCVSASCDNFYLIPICFVYLMFTL